MDDDGAIANRLAAFADQTVLMIAKARVAQGDDSGAGASAAAELRTEYQYWYNEAIKLLDGGLRERFRAEFEGTAESPRIEGFLERPQERTVHGWFRPVESSFVRPIERQAQVLREMAGGLESPLEPESSRGQRRTRRNAILLGMGTLVVALIVAGVNFAARGGGKSDAPQASAAGPDCQSGFCVTRDWPTFRGGCDPATSIAMSPGKLDFASVYAEQTATSDFRVIAANAEGGGSWKSGHLYMLMASADGTPVTISNIQQHRAATRLPPPAWVFTPSGDCGDVYSRVFEFNLDDDTFIDMGLQGNEEASDGRAAPKEPLGPAFVVTDREPALVRVDVISCNDNYSWTLDINFVRNGKKETRTIGPYRSMGRAENTELHKMDPYTGKLSPGVTRFSSKADDKC